MKVRDFTCFRLSDRDFLQGTVFKCGEWGREAERNTSSYYSLWSLSAKSTVLLAVFRQGGSKFSSPRLFQTPDIETIDHHGSGERFLAQ